MTTGHSSVSWFTVKWSMFNSAAKLRSLVGGLHMAGTIACEQTGDTVFGSAITAAALVANNAPAHADAPPTPGIKIYDETSFCTSAFTAEGNDGNYYLMTSGHCDAHDGSTWTYGDDHAPLGKITAGEYAETPEGSQITDAALIRLESGVGVPSGDIAGKYGVHDALSLSQIKIGAQMCKVGAVTGETCAPITNIEGTTVVEADLRCLGGDSGSPGFVKNAKWGLRLLS
jgi:hypothetical protein